MKKISVILIIGLMLFSFGCKQKSQEIKQNQDIQNTILLTSPSFNNLDRIPIKYTGYGDDVSPSLQWSNIPLQTQSFAIVMDDPDAHPSTFTHWLIFNIPADTTQLEEAVPKDLTLQDGSKQGKNDFGKIGYNGSRPPSGQTHRYVFTVYAIDTFLELKGGVSIKEFQKAVAGHILAKGTLIGIYGE